jgi:hypothetical protein
MSREAIPMQLTHSIPQQEGDIELSLTGSTETEDWRDAKSRLLLEEIELELPQGPSTIRNHHLRWTPLFLRRATLLSFAALFVFLIVMLEVVRKLSKDEQGFGPTKSSKHFIWTYVPAAGMVLLIPHISSFTLDSD